MVNSFFLELSEEELMDLEALLIDGVRNTTAPHIKRNLESSLLKIKQLKKGSERDLISYC